LAHIRTRNDFCLSESRLCHAGANSDRGREAHSRTTPCSIAESGAPISESARIGDSPRTLPNRSSALRRQCADAPGAASRRPFGLTPHYENLIAKFMERDKWISPVRRPLSDSKENFPAN
jgi:hypothetical protein